MHDLRLYAVLDKRMPATGCLIYTVFTPHKHSIEKLPPYVQRLLPLCVISRGNRYSNIEEPWAAVYLH
jgi:hypothetical protein